ncbi:MAG TPA: YkgJ family cysteine cluster protein [Candidatus Baltobacteraceae bacterium]
MQETIDLISHAAMRELRAFSRRTHQPTDMALLDTEPMEQVASIEIDEEHITIIYNQKTTHRYNVDETTNKEWVYKYNEDPEFVDAVATVIALARKNLRNLPENVSCPPGCAECCSGYEPFVSKQDVQRIADHLKLTYEQVLRDYVVQRPSADGFVVGYLRKVTDDIASQCVFLKGRESGEHYCGIYEGRPHDCGAFTPIGCEDVDTNLKHGGPYVVGAPFRPKHRPTKSGRSRKERR